MGMTDQTWSKSKGGYCLLKKSMVCHKVSKIIETFRILFYETYVWTTQSIIYVEKILGTFWNAPSLMTSSIGWHSCITKFRKFMNLALCPSFRCHQGTLEESSMSMVYIHTIGSLWVRSKLWRDISKII